MRRLRYQIGHYEKHGQCETREYSAGSDPATDRTVAALVDAWKAGKKQIGPYVDHSEAASRAGICPVIAACSSPTAMGSSTMPS